LTSRSLENTRLLDLTGVLSFVDVIGTKIREENIVFSMPKGFYPTPHSTIV